MVCLNQISNKVSFVWLPPYGIIKIIFFVHCVSYELEIRDGGLIILTSCILDKCTSELLVCTSYCITSGEHIWRWWILELSFHRSIFSFSMSEIVSYVFPKISEACENSPLSLFQFLSFTLFVFHKSWASIHVIYD